MIYLQFASEAAARLALAPWIVENAWPSYIEDVAVDVVGRIQRPTGSVIETPEGAIPEMALIPGWHVNLSAPVSPLAAYEIPAPSTPDRVFAGSGDVSPPRVPAEVARWQAKLALMHQVDGQGVSLWDRLQQLRESLTDAEQQTMLDAAMNEVLNWKRPSPTVLWAAEQLELTAQKVDELFIYAHALEL